MGYRLKVTKRAEELLDSLVCYFLLELGNEPAVGRLMDEVEKIYGCLECNPLQFPISCDEYLYKKGYREGIVPGMGYRIVFCLDSRTVTILGIFHWVENFQGKFIIER
ncbi:MAG: type II toxin-antitoxin system RelE/ParE family toxin [Lachnospiraceae bacterium]|jgi:hypothetical protein|nr:type II toxin-antitoxin system RelE/ParE family toxin [Lachnospiraceae bacterium]